MARKKHRCTRSGGFSGVKAYIWYVECREKFHDEVDRSFYDAINKGLYLHCFRVIECNSFDWVALCLKIATLLVLTGVCKCRQRTNSTRAGLSASAQ